MVPFVSGILSRPAGFVVLLVLTIVILIAITAWQNRRHLARTERKQCPHCGGLFPASAKFCGRCGKSF